MIPYATLMHQLGLANIRQLEDFVIGECFCMCMMPSAEIFVAKISHQYCRAFAAGALCMMFTLVDGHRLLHL